MRASGVFFLATTEGDQARVRPFGVCADIHNRLYIGTSNDKKCFRQMIDNPKVEMSAMLGNDWLRVTGTVRRDDSVEARAEFLRQCPYFADFHTADDGLFEVLYFDSGTMEVYSHEEGTIVIEL